MHSVTKPCADHLRDLSRNRGFKLGASHAHEIVAAVLGYKSYSALLTDKTYPAHKLTETRVILLTEPSHIEKRLQELKNLPQGLPDKFELGFEALSPLVHQKILHGKLYGTSEHLAEKFANRFMDVQGEKMMAEHFGMLGITRQFLGKPLYTDEVKVQKGKDSTNITLIRRHQGFYNFVPSPHRLDIIFEIILPRVAARIGYRSPTITAKVQIPEPEVFDFA